MWDLPHQQKLDELKGNAASIIIYGRMWWTKRCRMSEFRKESDDLVNAAEQAVRSGRIAFCKFLSANDTGLTGAHQSGIYIPKTSFQILFDKAGVKGSNKEKNVSINWQDGSRTDSRFIYYGQKTRNEYRITRFGRNFEFLRPQYTGALFILVQEDETQYQAFVFNEEEQIDDFLQHFTLTPTATNTLITTAPDPKFLQNEELSNFIARYPENFPDSRTMSEAARNIEEKISDHCEYIVSNPDQKLINWVNLEYDLFRAIEADHYLPLVQKGFSELDTFVEMAQSMLNRRKSRAGKSFENHLSALFRGNNLIFEEQVYTEGKKKLDFLFPSRSAYHDPSFPAEHLVSLAAKTTCKDRWRQILNEANRLRNGKKYLCTLQRGVSPDQMKEMESEQVVLVVPQPYICEYPPAYRGGILSLRKFIELVKGIEQP